MQSISTIKATHIRSLIILSLFILISITAFFSTYQFTQEANRIIIRLTAQAAVILFSLSFMASGLHHFLKNNLTAYLLKNRAFMGLSFGVFHTAHLISLFVLQCNFHPVFEKAKLSSLAAGGIAYIFMYLMMFTSFDKFKQKLNTQTWKILHTIGAYWIWFIFINSYYKNIIDRQRYYFFFALLMMSLAVRIGYLIFKKRPIR